MGSGDIGVDCSGRGFLPNGHVGWGTEEGRVWRPPRAPKGEAQLSRQRATKEKIPGRLPSIVLLALYTRAREEEICCLKVDDIDEAHGAYFVRVQDSKTKAGIRELGISHPMWQSLSTNCPGQAGGGRDQTRSHYVSRQYTVIRRKLGMPDGPDFHSFRRNLMSIVENRGVEDVPIARYVGDKIPTLMHSTYSGVEAGGRAV